MYVALFTYAYLDYIIGKLFTSHSITCNWPISTPRPPPGSLYSIALEGCFKIVTRADYLRCQTLANTRPHQSVTALLRPPLVNQRPNETVQICLCNFYTDSEAQYSQWTENVSLSFAWFCQKHTTRQKTWKYWALETFGGQKLIFHIKGTVYPKRKFNCWTVPLRPDLIFE